MMLSAVPPISQSFLLHPSPFRTSNPDPPPSTHQSHQHGHQFRPNPPSRPTRSVLSTLIADEASFAASKERVRKFGAGWLKPPGLTKTLQGMEDDRIEREEQEAVANRELAMFEEQAAAEQAQAAQGLLQGDGTMELGEEGEVTERDLDAEVPEADGEGGWETSSSAEEDEEDAEDGENTEERMDVEAGQGGGSVSSGLEEGVTRDLDDDVPEAGSYQHTDTDIEDESSDGSDIPGARRSSGRRSAQRIRGQQLNSSLLDSSPVEQRRGRGGGRRSSGRRSHGS